MRWKYGDPLTCRPSDDDAGSVVEFFPDGSDGAEIIAFVEDFGDEMAVATRFIDCVNACSGMEDPEAEIARLRRERDTAMAAAAEIAKSTGEALVRLRKVEEAARQYVAATDSPGESARDALDELKSFLALRSALREKTEGGGNGS
jgi:hypothetical protein